MITNLDTAIKEVQKEHTTSSSLSDDIDKLEKTISNAEKLLLKINNETALTSEKSTLETKIDEAKRELQSANQEKQRLIELEAARIKAKQDIAKLDHLTEQQKTDAINEIEAAKTKEQVENVVKEYTEINKQNRDAKIAELKNKINTLTNKLNQANNNADSANDHLTLDNAIVDLEKQIKSAQDFVDEYNETKYPEINDDVNSLKNLIETSKAKLQTARNKLVQEKKALDEKLRLAKQKLVEAINNANEIIKNKDKSKFEEAKTKLQEAKTELENVKTEAENKKYQKVIDDANLEITKANDKIAEVDANIYIYNVQFNVDSDRKKWLPSTFVQDFNYTVTNHPSSDYLVSHEHKANDLTGIVYTRFTFAPRSNPKIKAYRDFVFSDFRKYEPFKMQNLTAKSSNAYTVEQIYNSIRNSGNYYDALKDYATWNQNDKERDEIIEIHDLTYDEDGNKITFRYKVTRKNVPTADSYTSTSMQDQVYESDLQTLDVRAALENVHRGYVNYYNPTFDVNNKDRLASDVDKNHQSDITLKTELKDQFEYEITHISPNDETGELTIKATIKSKKFPDISKEFEYKITGFKKDLPNDDFNLTSDDLKLDYLKTKYNFVNYYGMFKQFWDNETTVGYKNPTTLFKDIFNRSNEVISADYISGEGKFKYSYNKTKQNVIIGKNQDGSYITKAITKKYDKEVSILRLLESIHYAFVLSNKTFQNSTPSISGFQELWEWHALTYNVGTNEMKQKVDLIKSILNNPHTNSLIKTILESGDYQKALSNHDYLKGEFQKTINTSLELCALFEASTSSPYYNDFKDYANTIRRMINDYETKYWK